MSGKLITIGLVMFCCGLAAYALLRQSQSTQHVRQMWGAAGAHAIQSATDVVWYPAGGQQPGGLDVSVAPGLIHLRATLVDDNYFDLSAEEPASAGQPKRRVDRFEFRGKAASVVVWVDANAGWVGCEQTGGQGKLILPSQKAVQKYLEELTKEAAGVDE